MLNSGSTQKNARSNKESHDSTMSVLDTGDVCLKFDCSKLSLKIALKILIA